MNLSTKFVLRFIEEWRKEHGVVLTLEEAKGKIKAILLMNPDSNLDTYNPEKQ